MHGECDEATLDRAWQAAEVFVLPTLYEGYGMAVAEALARGLPIISTRTGGIAAMVGDDAGRIVEPGDAAALGAALGAVIRDPELRASMAGAARLRATALPQWPAAVRAWAAVLAAVGAEA
jgi:glycosyltransferase involved in cell wall biosynthesis